MRRLFIGSYLSTQQQELLGQLKNYDQRLSAHWHSKLRWVKPIKLHLTWQFLGDVDDSQLDAIKSALENLLTAQKPLQITYDHPELWPSAKKPRHLVLVPGSNVYSILALGKQIRTALGTLVSKPDNHDFRPHVTLLRLDNMAKQAALEPPLQSFRDDGIAGYGGERSAAACGVSRITPYSPQLPTQTGARASRPQLPEWFDLEFLPFTQEIRSINLIESHLGRGADEYETLTQYELH